MNEANLHRRCRRPCCPSAAAAAPPTTATATLALVLLALSCRREFVSRALLAALVGVPVVVAAPVYQYFDGSQPMQGLLLGLTIGMPAWITRPP